MSTLVKHSTPAERACGLSLALGFDSAEDVARAGGTITGTPTIAHGLATLNGTTDYITYALTGNEFNSAEISIVIEFWPDFDYDNNAESALFCTDTSVEYTVYKRNNAGSNELGILLGGTLIAFVVQGTYSPYWRVGERNVLVISGTTGATNAWLNGTQILTASATAWTPSGRTSLTIGRRTNGTRYFDGKIGPIKVFKGLLDGQDALNFYNKNTYSYMESSVLHLPMRAQEHDPTGVQTLDIANGNHAQFGDGSTPTTYPTKLAKRGYYFDGGDYLNAGDTTSLRLTSTGTVACFFEASNYSSDVGLIVKGRFATDRNGYFLFLHGATGVVRGIVANGATKNEVDAVTPTPAGIHTAILVWNGTIVYLYIDGRLEDTAVQSINATSDGYDLVFGTVSDGAGSEFTGNMFDSIVTADPLSQIQVADLHIRMMKGINQV